MIHVFSVSDVVEEKMEKEVFHWLETKTVAASHLLAIPKTRL